MPSLQYKNPPVHEVVVAVNFVGELDAGTLQQVQRKLRDSSDFAEISPLLSSQVIMVPGSPDLPPRVQEGQRTFDGWLFRDDPPGQVLRVQRSAFTYNVVRPGDWPKGPYPGWNAILAKYRTYHEALTPHLEDVPVRRIGLRYLNRIAIPERDEPKDWFNIKLEAPSYLEKTHAFDIRQTWGNVGAGEDISITISLKKIEIEDRSLASGHQGVLLDIDVFNLLPRDAPDYRDVLGWLDRAHSVENKVFESCVTDTLRATFGGINASKRDAVG